MTDPRCTCRRLPEPPSDDCPFHGEGALRTKDERNTLRAIIQAERDLAYLIWLLNINSQASNEAEKLWKRLDRRLERMKR